MFTELRDEGGIRRRVVAHDGRRAEAVGEGTCRGKLRAMAFQDGFQDLGLPHVDQGDGPGQTSKRIELGQLVRRLPAAHFNGSPGRRADGQEIGGRKIDRATHAVPKVAQQLWIQLRQLFVNEADVLCVKDAYD